MGYKMWGGELRARRIVWTESGVTRSNEKTSGSYEVKKEWRRSVNEQVVGFGARLTRNIDQSGIRNRRDDAE